MNDVQPVSPSLPTKSGTALSITLLCMLTLTVIHAELTHLPAQTHPFPQNNGCRFKQARLRNKVGR